MNFNLRIILYVRVLFLVFAVICIVQRIDMDFTSMGQIKIDVIIIFILMCGIIARK